MNPEKIEVIYPGIPALPKVNEDFVQKTLKKFKISKPYFFHIRSQDSFRKNTIGIIKAFKLFRESGFDCFLVIAGAMSESFYLEVKKEACDKVILIGKISDEEKVVFYKEALAYIFPSFYEGFGLPVLEAQSLGTPVLTSNISSLPEVAGDSALLVNPYNIEEIAKGMEALAKDNVLREELIAKGYQNIKRFSWEKSAQKLVEIFHSIV